MSIDHFTFLRALQYAAENGYRWRALPKEFGNWFRQVPNVLSARITTINTIKISNDSLHNLKS